MTEEGSLLDVVKQLVGESPEQARGLINETKKNLQEVVDVLHSIKVKDGIAIELILIDNNDEERKIEINSAGFVRLDGGRGYETELFPDAELLEINRLMKYCEKGFRIKQPVFDR